MVGKTNQNFELGRVYREVCMKLAETESNILMFNSMIRRHVATNDVKQFAIKQAAQCRVYKSISLKLEKVAMKLKRADALAYAKRLRQEKYKIKQNLISTFEDKKKAKKIIDV